MNTSYCPVMSRRIAPYRAVLGCLGLLTVLCGCASPVARTPMPSVQYGSAQADCALIFLPGLRDRMQDFEARGFIEAWSTRSSGRECTLIAADAHIGYYKSAQFSTRFAADVLKRVEGKYTIIVGVSLGGLGSIIAARRHRIDELVLLAPYLGQPEFLARVQREDLAIRDSDDRLERVSAQVWQFLLNNRKAAKITLAYGLRDRMTPSFELLRAKRPDIDVITTQGGHNWSTWLVLWRTWLDKRLNHNAPLGKVK